MKTSTGGEEKKQSKRTRSLYDYCATIVECARLSSLFMKLHWKSEIARDKKRAIE